MSKINRLMNMRDCLKQVKGMLPLSSDHENGRSSQFICHTVDHTTFSEDTKRDTRNYVFKSLQGSYTFQCWMERNNQGRYFNPRRIMTLRRKWVDQLVKALNTEIKKLNILEE